jgi:hypothetical protein
MVRPFHHHGWGWGPRAGTREHGAASGGYGVDEAGRGVHRGPGERETSGRHGRSKVLPSSVPPVPRQKQARPTMHHHHL